MGTALVAGGVANLILLVACARQYRMGDYKWAIASATIAAFNAGLLMGIHLATK